MSEFNSLESLYGPLYSIKQVLELLNVKNAYTIWAMTYVSGRKNLKNKSIQKRVEKYKEGENLQGIYTGNGSIYITETSIQKYLLNHVNRDPSRDRKIIENANNSLLILGINGLGPLHQNRELIFRLLENNGTVRVLLLDPRSPSFEERVTFEKCFPNQSTNRLIFEFLASFAICKEISECSGSNTDFILKLYSSEPIMSLVVTDYKNENGILNQNMYPKVKGSRGMAGSSFQIEISKDKAHFEGLIEKYLEIFDSAVPVDLNANPNEYLKTNPLC